MPYVFNDDLSRADFEKAIESMIDDLKDACWGWLEV